MLAGFDIDVRYQKASRKRLFPHKDYFSSSFCKLALIASHSLGSNVDSPYILWSSLFQLSPLKDEALPDLSLKPRSYKRESDCPSLGQLINPSLVAKARLAGTRNANKAASHLPLLGVKRILRKGVRGWPDAPKVVNYVL